MCLKKQRLIFTYLVEVICIALMIVYLYTPSLSIMTDQMEKDAENIPLEAYFIGTSDASGICPMPVSIQNENVWDFSTKLRENAKEFRATATEAEQVISQFQGLSDSSSETADKEIAKLQREVTLLKRAATACVVIGILGYVLVVSCWSFLGIGLVTLFIYIKTGREEFDKLSPEVINKTHVPQTLLIGFCVWIFLILVQVAVHGSFNEDAKSTYLRVMFTGGMHVWIPMVGLTLLSYIGQPLVQYVLRSPAED